MKIHEYLNNPAGKGAIIPGKNLILTNYDYRFQVLTKEKSIELKIYTNNEDVFYHMLIPTESDKRENKYDVVIKFSPSDKSNLIDKSYKQYDISFFSNCPSFTYTYAYVAKLNGYIIPELENKYDEKVLNIPPVSRNPGLIFGYEKSIYFACQHLLSDRELLLKSHVKTYGQKLTKNLLKDIRHTNKIDEDIQREKNKYKENKKEAIKQNKREKKEVKNYNKKKSESSINIIKKNQPVSKKVSSIKPIKKRK